jgi:hypothetical protein
VKKQREFAILKDSHMPEPKIKGFVYSKNKRIRNKQLKKRLPVYLSKVVGEYIDNQIISALAGELKS